MSRVTSASPHTKQAAQRLTALCCLIYFASYLTRLDYGAALAEIILDLEISKESAILAVTGSFITYGVGQLFSGALGDRFSPRRIIALGLAATSLCNIAVALLDSIAAITVLWCLNGFFQSMLWPPLVKVMVQNLPKRDYERGCVLVSGAATVGTIAVYLLVPLCIQLESWRLSFHSAAVFGLLSAVLWLRGTRTLSQPLTFSSAAPLSQPPPARPARPGSASLPVGSGAGAGRHCGPGHSPGRTHHLDAHLHCGELSAGLRPLHSHRCGSAGLQPCLHFSHLPSPQPFGK